MKVENGKVVKLAIVNHLSNGIVWGTYEQIGIYPDDFPHKPLRNALLNMELHIRGCVAHNYVGGLQRTPELIFKLPLDNVKANKPLSLGMVFKTRSQMKTFTGIITDIGEDEVTLDCNHPDTGISAVTTAFTVVAIRDATLEELNGAFKPSLIAL